MHVYQPVKLSLEKGFTLVEFMIAITISMIILLAVSIAWQSGLVTQNTQKDASRLNETVRFSIDLISREFKQAGLIDPLIGNDTPFSFSANPAIVGINDPATIDPTAANTAASLAGTTVTVLNKSDAIQVSYYADPTSEGQANGNGSGTSGTYDCLGNLVTNANNAPPVLVSDTLYVATDPNNISPDMASANTGEPALWCYTTNGGGIRQPMVAGVESLQILYGIDTDGDNIINQYVPWNQIISPSPSSYDYHDHILSIKVSIVARSPNPVGTGTGVTGGNYYHFSQYYQTTGLAAANNDTGTLFTAPATPANRLRLVQPLSTEIATRYH